VEFNIADLFEDVVDHVGEREALVAEKDGTRVRLTYAELDARANRLAHHLRAQGIGPGDHVGCHLQNGNEYIEAMLACFKIRAVPVNVNYRYVEDELAYLYGDADLKATVVDAGLLGRVLPLRDRLPLLRHLVVVGTQVGEHEDVVAYEDALAESSPERGFATRSADDLMIIYTGGTTGMPKGVMWRHGDIFFAGMLGGNSYGDPAEKPEDVAQTAANGGGLTMFPAAPLMHGAAELASFIAFWGGHRIVLIRSFSGHGALELIEQEKINTLSIVGDAMAVPILDALEERSYDLSSLIALGSAGAILSKSTRDRFLEHCPNLIISDAFGATEVGYTGPGTADSSPEQGLKFQPNGRTRVVSDDLRLLEPGSEEVGRVAQRGHIPVGYYNDQEKTAETFVEIDGDRYVLLGDRATVDADGVIHFLGRGSVCINSGGEKIYPEEVEAAIKAHPDIRDAVVAGIPDARWGHRCCAVIQVRDGATPPTQQEIEAHLESRIARYKVPKLFHSVRVIERSPSGKPDYRWARAQLERAASAGEPTGAGV
jgi:3-oxocholest-4-en-26-oate---CoA ligase